MSTILSAIIVDKYLNFCSRVGYYYRVFDAYCDETINKNHIVFTFKGGAAEKVRRNRRVRADNVNAQLKKDPR
jgi:pyruvate, water dikinase